jgi:hypothetical protein
LSQPCDGLALSCVLEPMSEIENTVQDAIAEVHSPLNSRVAVIVATVATLMAIGNIKDGNIVQNMTQAQSRAVGQWNYYQAKSTKQILAENAAAQLRALSTGAPAAAREAIVKALARFDSEAVRYAHEKEDVKKMAEQFEAEYDRLNVHDDQFDMAEACFTIAITLAGVAALTRKSWLLGFGTSIAAAGFILELSGFLGWAFHPAWLARLLG